MKKIKITKKNIVIASTLLAVFLIFLIIDFYFYNITQNLTQNICRFIPLPVVVINKKEVITTRDLISNTNALKKFYDSQDFSQLGLRVDFSTKEGKFRLKIKEKEVLDKRIESKIVENLAKKFNIKITKAEAQKNLSNRLALSNQEPKNFALEIRRLYDWSLDEYIENIVIPEIYLNKLYDYYDNEIKIETESYKKISQAKNELNENSLNFEEISKKYSEGESAKNGGQLGWFNRVEIIDEVKNAIISMKPGETSDVITSPLGYHIVYLEDIRETEKESGIKQKEVKIKQIFIQNGGFLDWLIEQKKQNDIIILMKDYKWNKEKTEVEFRNSNMQNQEEKIRNKSLGDPSMNL